MAQKILVAEDSQDIRFMISRSLKRAGFEVLEAQNPEEALRLYEQNKDMAGAIVDGTLLERYDGIKLVEELRRKGFEGTIVGHSTEADTERRFKEAGADLFKEKTGESPFSLPAIMSFQIKLRNNLKAADSRQEAALSSKPTGPSEVG